MKTITKPNKTTPDKKSGNDQKTKTDTGNPKKPGYDPDQTPKREVEHVPVANPNQND